MPATAPTGVDRDGKPAVKIRFIHDVEEHVTRIDHGTRYANPAVEAAEHQRQLSLATSGGQDMATTPAAGGGGHKESAVGKVVPWLAVALIVLLLGNAVMNRFESKPLFSGYTSDSTVPGTRSSPGTPGGGYVTGAPRTPAECRLRGGTNTGRGCSNYQ